MFRARTATAGLVAALFAGGVHAQFCTPFADVAAGDPFCADIQWLFNRGITDGCTATAFCPAQFVRRDQMARFMNRLGNITFQQGGNAFGVPGVLGTTDNQPLDIRVNGARVMRYEPNATSPNVIGGSPVNTVAGGVYGAAIGGGGAATEANRVTDIFGTVAGGFDNQAGDDAGDVFGAGMAAVGGGSRNRATATLSTVAGGANNGATGFVSTIGGGSSNTASGSESVVAGGVLNTATAVVSAVGGGNANVASGFASTVPGGQNNTASASFTFAAGRRAKATTQGTFMWADSRNFDFQPSVDNFFGVRATGGAGITVAIDPVSGAVTQFCNLLPGVANWQCTSDRHAKENFQPVDGDRILARLTAMPLFSWNFKGADPAIRNLGPTSQDFHAAFGLGTDPTAIASGNLHGVALAAIKGLNAKVDSLQAAHAAALAQRDARMDKLVRELANARLAHDAQAREIDRLRQAVERAERAR